MIEKTKQKSLDSAIALLARVFSAYAVTQGWDEQRIAEELEKCKKQLINAKDMEISALAQSAFLANALHEVSGDLQRGLERTGYSLKSETETDRCIV